MRKAILTLFIMLLLMPLLAQYDERQILVQEANQHLIRRDYSQAETVFLQILQKYPDDLNSILQLMQIYLNLSASDKAEALLNKYQRTLSQQVYTEQQIQLLILQGKLPQAYQMSEAYLQLNAQDQNKYRLVASYFERRAHFEYSVQIYQKARVKLGDTLFMLEIANANMQLQRYTEALKEYLAFMANSQNVNLFVKNQIKSIVEQDSSLIAVIQQAAKTNASDIILELLASSLLAVKQEAQAMEIYKRLPATYMRTFARDQLKLQNYALARAATRHLAETSPQPLQSLSFRFEIAQIFYEEALFDSCATVLDELMADPFWKVSLANKRNNLNVSIHRLKADNDLARGVNLVQVRQLLQDTKQYSTQALVNQELDLDLARLSILSFDYNGAELALARVQVPQLLEKRDYLYFLSAFMQIQSTHADSLMHEYMLKHPGGDFANDIIYLNMLSIGLDDAQKGTFAQSIRELQLFQKAGIDSLKILFDATGDEELLLLAIEWAIGLDDNVRAASLLEHVFTDQLSAEYAQYLGLALISDRAEEIDLAKEFLKRKPNSIFSPRFRQVISRQAMSHVNI
ncbi:MAG: tetratricopeptide repeat protein [Candidatus Cloacimonetes bacterium]|nr:tetratricopeptide repeat protein [Candidatus Cloacimonadota bacterium]MDY0172229.1 tetratricopeptide repeat protein [Candidatus Cloacimonadaceae bacterium]